MMFSRRSKQRMLQTAFSYSVLLVTSMFLMSQPVGAAEPAGWSFTLPDRSLFVFEPSEPHADDDSTVQAPQPFDSSDKLHLAQQRIFSKERLVGTAVTAGLSQATDSPLQRGYGNGFDGYLKRFGSHTAFWASKDLVGHVRAREPLESGSAPSTSIAWRFLETRGPCRGFECRRTLW